MVAGVRTSDPVVVWCVQMKQKTGRVCQAAIKTFGRIYTEIL